MFTSRNLKPMLRSAVTLVMASSGVTGCGDVGPGIERDPGFVSTSCEAHERDLLAGLRPEPEQEYLALHSLWPDGSGDAVASFGTACKTAEDEAACLTALEQVPDADGFRLGSCAEACFRYYLTANQGDTVRLLDSKEQIADLLGTVDTPEEAMFLVGMEGLDVRCGDGGAKPEGTGFAVQGFTYEGCDGVTRHVFGVTADGELSHREQVVLREANPNCVVGRRPAGLAAQRRRCDSVPTARYLAEAARLEAASVYAFVHIERELAAHGAPRRLLTAARRAAADEVRHARMTAGLARRFGATRVERPRVAPTPARDLESLLLDNAVEGCVRETFGAAMGIWQAKNAADRVVAKAMRQIAADEQRHAALAWEIAAWFEPKLDETALRRVRQARRAAIADLRAELERRVDPSIVHSLGVPSAANALRLHRELELRVWS
ncbi:MAG: ferritin-like domain-containing protein [Myxococcales bacterium]|nr:MAG: ferritin-like domain-containing protein [Myxococcales bacterium]